MPTRPERRANGSLWASALAVFTLALALRALHLWQIRRAPFFTLLMGDALSYDRWAQRIADGDWLGREVFYQAPLYPYLLGVLYAVFGHDPMVARIAQIVLGSLACAFITVAGGRLFGPRAGLVAGVLLAIYGPAIFFDGLIQKATLDVLFLSALLLVIALLVEEVTFARAIVAGAILGNLALTRENAMVLFPPLLAWIAWRTWLAQRAPQPRTPDARPPDARTPDARTPDARTPDARTPHAGTPHAGTPHARTPNARTPHALLPALALTLGLAIVLTPVAIRNVAVGGELHLTTSQGGPNFYIGNHEGATGTYVPLRNARGSAAYEQQDAVDLAQQALGRSLTPGEVSSYWWHRGFAWIAAHPAAWFELMLKKLALTWNAEEATDTEDLYSHADWSWPLKIGTTILHFGLLAPLAALGIWLTRHRWRDLWGLYAMIAIYTISVAAFFVLARYRYPLVPFLALFAGAALAELPAWWRSRSSTTAGHAREKWQAAVVVVLVAITCNWPLLSAAETRAVTHYNIGYEMQTRGQSDDAIAEYRTALALVPDYALAHSNLGVLLTAQGHHDDARTHYREALRLDPTLVDALINLGIDFAETGQLAEAIDTLERAIALDPKNPGAHDNLAAVHNNLGIQLASAGRLDEGITHFRAALALRPDYPEATANLQQAQAMSR